MTENEFIEKFKDILETEVEITFDTELSDLDDWDSLTVMTTVGWLKGLNVNATVSELTSLETVKDLAKKAGVAF